MTDLQVKHAPSSTETLVAWLLDPEITISADLRREIAERLQRLEEQKSVFYDIGALYRGVFR